ncbi:MAG: beta-aspartyl-peptidase [Solobacterium sp.]|nr:beta-aspartyl-peptidase [Solobacterium sp.]
MFLLIKNAHVYSPEDLGIQDVLICNQKIIRIHPHIDFTWDEDFTVIDAKEKILVPGFIDQHVHIIGGGGEDGFASLIREIQFTDCIRYGVTTVIGLLGTDHHAKSVETLVAKTKALKEQGMSAYCLTGSYTYPSNTLTGSVGRDIAFIDEIIGVKIAISDHRSSNVSKQELARIATEARTAALLSKKPGVVHMHTGKGKDGYKKVMEIIEETDIPIFHFRPTHVANQLEDAYAFADMGGYIDFTSGTDIEKTAETLQNAMKRVPLSQITLSSDSNGSFPVWSEDKKIIGMGVGKMETLYDTIRCLIKEKHVPVCEAIRLITLNVADALLLKQKGRIEKDADADLVLLDENLDIDTVITLGKITVQNQEVKVKNYYNYE